MAKIYLFQVKGKDSGTKTLLLLHRSMAFILEFITGLKNSNSKTRAVDVAQQAFDKTMAQYYSWLVNKMASVAFNALPSTKVSMCISTKTSCLSGFPILFDRALKYVQYSFHLSIAWENWTW